MAFNLIGFLLLITYAATTVRSWSFELRNEQKKQDHIQLINKFPCNEYKCFDIYSRLGDIRIYLETGIHLFAAKNSTGLVKAEHSETVLVWQDYKARQNENALIWKDYEEACAAPRRMCIYWDEELRARKRSERKILKGTEKNRPNRRDIVKALNKISFVIFLIVMDFWVVKFVAQLIKDYHTDKVKLKRQEATRFYTSVKCKNAHWICG